MKYTDWEHRLRNYIAARRRIAYALGTNDCCIFVADAVQAMTGTDYAAKYRGLYTTQDEAEAIIRQHGGLAGLVTDLLEIHPDAPLTARVGDVVLAETPNGEAVGIVVDHRAAFIANRDINLRPLSDLKAVWHIE